MSVLHKKDGRPDLQSQNQIQIKVIYQVEMMCWKKYTYRSTLRHVEIEIGGFIDAVTTHIRFVCHPSLCDRRIYGEGYVC